MANLEIKLTLTSLEQVHVIQMALEILEGTIADGQLTETDLSKMERAKLEKQLAATRAVMKMLEGSK